MEGALSLPPLPFARALRLLIDGGPKRRGPQTLIGEDANTMLNVMTQRMLTKRLTIDGTNYILAAGTSDVNSGSVDTAGFDVCRFVMSLGAIVATGAVEIQIQGSDDDTNWSDLTGTSQVVTDADDNKLIIAEIIQPRHRYLRVQTIRGDAANSTIDNLIAELSHPRKEPVTKDATVISQEIHQSPAAGTA